MPEFNYRAVDPGGRVVTGSMTAESLLTVRQSIKSDGSWPIEIKQGREPAAPINLSFIGLKKEISGEALSQFCRQLSVIIMSGVNILKGLEIMARQTPDKRMRAEVERVYREVQTGKTLAEAMSGRGSLIPDLLVAMVATGEASGSLDEVLRNMSEFYEKEHRVRQKIKSASIYPIVMLVMAAALIAFFFNFLLPQMVTLITASGGELPLLTRIVIGISQYTTKYFVLIIGSLAGLIVFSKMYFKTAAGRMQRDKFILRIPMLGNTLRHVTTMRFARTAYILIKSGLPLLQGLDYIKQNLNNALAEKAVEHAIDGLQRGESMASNLARADYFDGMAIQMFSIGEETGELEKVLDEMARYYDQESDAGFTKLLALVEPMMLVIIGSIVSVVIISVMLPMMGMFSTIKR